MKKEFVFRCSRTQKPEAGMSLIETMIAVLLMLIAAATVMALAMTAITTTENQGHLAARTAEYAQDKMEQLLALRYCDSTSDTTVFPSSANGGTGLGGCVNPGNPGLGILPDPDVPGGTVGGLNPAAPVAGYADYLCVDGSYVGTNGCTQAAAYYIRVWQITNPAGPAGTPCYGHPLSSCLKQITVVTQVRYGVGGRGALPQSTVTAIKSYPF